MARNKMPRFWGAKAARAKEAKAIRTVEQRQQKLNDLRKATGEVVIMCMIAAAHDGFGLGEERLERAIQTAVQRSIQFDIEKRPRMENGKPVNGMAIAGKNLDKLQISIRQHITYGREPGELKHLSSRRKRKKTRLGK